MEWTSFPPTFFLYLYYIGVVSTLYYHTYMMKKKITENLENKDVFFSV